MTEPGRLLTIPQTAERLAVSRGTVYALIARRELRAVDLAGPGSRSKTRIRLDDLAAFIEARTR